MNKNKLYFKTYKYWTWTHVYIETKRNTIIGLMGTLCWNQLEHDITDLKGFSLLR